MRLVLVRHGQTSSNVSHALDTAMPGADLDDVGREQARMLAQCFENMIGAKPSMICVSPLARCRQTAAYLETEFGLGAEVAEGIREILAGDLEMSVEPENIMVYLQTLLSWIQGDLDVQMPGGEDGWQTRRRLSEALNEALTRAEKLFGSDATVAVVCHGALSRLIATTLSDDVPAELVARYPMHNASTAVLEWTGQPGQSWIGEHGEPRLWKALTWSDQPIDTFILDDRPIEPEVSKLRDMVEDPRTL